jgi:SpoVK/Ycf46/Vps4 family AAA+-type ATPase
MVDVIIQTVLDHGPGIKWDDIEGLSGVKQTLVENIIYP